LDFIRFITGTDAESMAQIGWGYRVGGAILFVLIFGYAWFGPKRRR